MLPYLLPVTLKLYTLIEKRTPFLRSRKYEIVNVLMNLIYNFTPPPKKNFSKLLMLCLKDNGIETFLSVQGFTVRRILNNY